MPSRTPREAVTALIRPYRDVLRCVTDVGFVARGRRPGGPYDAQFQGGRVLLRPGRGLDSIRLKVSLRYTIEPSAERVGWWEAKIVGWIYEISTSVGSPIFDFHWHPHESGRVTWPHLHAYGVNDAVDLHKLHPPTGPVTVSSVVRFLIDDLGVRPRLPNWHAVLDHFAAV